MSEILAYDVLRQLDRPKRSDDSLTFTRSEDPVFVTPWRVARAGSAALGAIGLALIDTVIFTRGPDHADQIVEKINAHDPEIARLLGMTPEELPDAGDPMGFMSISGDIEQLSVTYAINEAWAMLAIITAVGLLSLLFARKETDRR